MAAPRSRDHPAPPESTYWDIGDVQFHCRVSRKTAWRLVRSDGFPAPVVIGRRVIWPRAEVVAFFEEKRDPNHYAPADTARTQRLEPFTLRHVRQRAS